MAMVMITDTPLQATRSSKMNGKQWVFIVLVSLFLASLSWGMDDSLAVGDVEGLQVRVDFLGFKGVGTGGTYQYERGGSVNYRVVLENKGNLSFQKIDAQSSLHSDGVSCDKYSVASGSLLPGASISRLYSLS